MKTPTPGELDAWPTLGDPTEGELGRARHRAVALGGAALQLRHSARSTTFQVKAATSRGPGQPVQIGMAHCEQVALFTLPIDEQPWQLAAGVVAKLRDKLTDTQLRANDTRYCVVDDAAHLWPRFQ